MSAIVIDLIFKMGNNYYLRKCHEECKYIVKKKNISIVINANISPYSKDVNNKDDDKFIEKDSEEYV